MMRISLTSALLSLFCISALHAGPTWQEPDVEKTPEPLDLLPSTFALSLPTTTTLQKHDLQFLVSHRFLPESNTGSQTLYGLDGGATIRLELSYAFHDKWMATLGRSNLNDNLELNVKGRILESHSNSRPWALATNFVHAWNMGGAVANRSKSDARNQQTLVQMIGNTLLKERWGLGLVASYLHNAIIEAPDTRSSNTLGTYVQYFFTTRWSAIWEYNRTVRGHRQWHDSMALGVELNTGGHFFKLLYSNNTNINATQYHAGAARPYYDGSGHFGLVITRLF